MSNPLKLNTSVTSYFHLRFIHDRPFSASPPGCCLPALAVVQLQSMSATAEAHHKPCICWTTFGAGLPTPWVEAGKVVMTRNTVNRWSFSGYCGLVADLPDKPERAELIKGVE